MVKRRDDDPDAALTAPQLAKRLGISYREFIRKNEDGVPWWMTVDAIRDAAYQLPGMAHYRFPPSCVETCRRACR